MDFEENLIKEYNQLKSRVNIKSGQHRVFGGVEILLDCDLDDNLNCSSDVFYVVC